MRPARTFQNSSKDKPKTEPTGATEAKTAEAPSSETSSTAGNAFDTSAYDYPTARPPVPRRAVIWVVVAAIALVCFCCGTAFGAVTLYWLEPLPPAAPVVPPTPEGLLLLFLLLFV